MAIGPTSPGHLPPALSYQSPQSSRSRARRRADGQDRRAHREGRVADRGLQAVRLRRGRSAQQAEAGERERRACARESGGVDVVHEASSVAG